MARSQAVAVRMSDEQIHALEDIAVERGIIGGVGKRPDEPNISQTIHALLAQADERLAARPSLEWERTS